MQDFNLADSSEISLPSLNPHNKSAKNILIVDNYSGIGAKKNEKLRMKNEKLT